MINERALEATFFMCENYLLVDQDVISVADANFIGKSAIDFLSFMEVDSQ